MTYFTHIKKIAVVLLFTIIPIRSMDLPKQPFEKLNEIEENNLIVHFSRHKLSDQDYPLVMACAEGNIAEMKFAIDKMPKNSKPKNTICQALFYIVLCNKSNNKNAFDLLCTHKKTKKWANSALSENIASFVQLAIFTRGWQLMPALILTCLQDEAIDQDLFYTSGSPKQQPDIFKALIKGSSVVMRANLFDIIKENHSDILGLFNNQEIDLKSYSESIKKLFSKKEIKELNSIAPFLADNDPCKKNTKGSGNKEEKCIIS